MTQCFDEKRNIVPVTLIEAGPCVVTQIKIKKTDGYKAVQIGFGRIKKITKQMKGHLKKIMNKNSEIKETDINFQYLREFKNEKNDYEIGQKLDISIFQEHEKVKISGISKGKGFQGGVKRWGFHGRNATHGVKHEQRTIGSVGCSYPERVIKGKKMPGRMGAKRITTKNLEIVKIDKENNLLAVKGAVPGARGTLLEIRT